MADPTLPPDAFDRAVRAVQKVRERLFRSTSALLTSQRRFSVIGAHAVAYWVAQRDSGAVRNTPNVDLLVRRGDFPVVFAALETAGFCHVADSNREGFIDGPNGSLRQAVQVWFAAEGLSGNPEVLFPGVEQSVQGHEYPVVELNALVGMKLGANRRIDKVHIQDMIGVGLIDATWPDRYLPVLADRLRELLADPDG